jgi:hypothetical protein
VTTETFVQVSGFALMLGGILATVGWLGFTVVDPGHNDTSGSLWMPLNLAIILGGVGMAMGLPGFYLGHAEQAGVLGLAAMVVLFVGIVVPYVGVHSIEAATAPAIPARMMSLVAIGAPALWIGTLLTAIAMLVANVYPWWQAAGLVAAVVLGPAPRFVPMPPVLRLGLLPSAFTALVAAIGYAVTRLPGP